MPNLDVLSEFQSISSNSVPLIDFHLHTNWTDGQNTVVEMHQQAVAKGLTHILFSEHARRGSEEWFGRFADEVRSLPSDCCRALVGVETKVLNLEGELDISPKVIEQCDLVMASVHRFPSSNEKVREFSEVSPDDALKMEFELSSAVLENPDADILGHPFGMSLKRYGIEPSENQFRQIMEKAGLNQVAFEINSYYHPEPWTLLKWCDELGTTVSLGSNAHSLKDVGQIVRTLLRE